MSIEASSEPRSLLEGLRVTVERILQRCALIGTHRSERLYKYLTFDSFRSMAPTSGRENPKERGLDLWVMDAEAMNDPLEGRYLLDTEVVEGNPPGANHLKKLFEHSHSRQAKGPLGNSGSGTERASVEGTANWLSARAHPLPLTFVGSFSLNGDDLDLWRHYCGGHGVSIGFHPRRLTPRLSRMQYGREAARDILAELSWPLERIITAGPSIWLEALAQLRPVMYLVKAAAHQSDKEVRLIEVRAEWSADVFLHPDKGGDGKQGARLYVKKERFFFEGESLAEEVIVGPLAEPFEQLHGADVFWKEVQYRLARNGAADVVVTQSRHLFRS